jgi:hypothetical protein
MATASTTHMSAHAFATLEDSLRSCSQPLSLSLLDENRGEDGPSCQNDQSTIAFITPQIHGLAKTCPPCGNIRNEQVRPSIPSIGHTTLPVCPCAPCTLVSKLFVARGGCTGHHITSFSLLSARTPPHQRTKGRANVIFRQDPPTAYLMMPL